MQYLLLATTYYVYHLYYYYYYHHHHHTLVCNRLPKHSEKSLAWPRKKKAENKRKKPNEKPI